MSPRPAKAADPAAMLDVLRRGVVLTADSVRAALDEAVRHGHLTPRDAAELSQALLSAGRAQADGLRSALEQVLGRGPAFPISLYDELTARQVQARLCDLTPTQLRKVRDHERRHANRKTVLAAIDSRMGPG